MITIIIGPMFSGKSTFLLMQERKSLLANKKVCLFKHKTDQRYTSDDMVCTHDGKMSKSITIQTELLLLEKYNENLKQSDVILIDEGQFFPDLLEFCLLFANKMIYISALSADFQQTMFPSIIQLLGHCDSIIHQKAICMKCGNDAPFSYRKVNNDTQLLIGGSDLYEPRCRGCFLL